MKAFKFFFSFIGNKIEKPLPRDIEIFWFVKKTFGTSPEKIELYKTALRHRSVTKRLGQIDLVSNERLEFLGDAVLDIVVAHYLYYLFPEKDEGFLTKMKSKIVGRANLNSLSVKLKIDAVIEANLGKSDASESINGDAFEALLGAIYLDKGYLVCQKTIHKIIKENIDISSLESTETDFKSKLIEWGQKEKKKIVFQCELVSSRNFEPMYVANVFIEGEIKGTAEGPSKKKAEQGAAEEGLIKITGELGYLH